MVVTAKEFAAKPISEADETRFFETIQLANGTFKTTAFSRLDDLNRMVTLQWKQMRVMPRQILDVAASSGITSLEWVEQLEREGFDVQLTATDLVFDGHLLTLLPGLQVLVDRSGHVLQYVVAGIPTTGFPLWMMKAGGARAVKIIADRLVSLRGGEALARRSKQKIVLAHARARNHPRINLVEDDLFSSPRPSMARHFDVVRAANILNLGYFDRPMLERGVLKLKERLKGAGSFLIVVRTLKDGTNHGSLFQLNANRFEVLDRVGSSSEIEDIVLAS
jgi:hypothetical protein